LLKRHYLASSSFPWDLCFVAVGNLGDIFETNYEEDNRMLDNVGRLVPVRCWKNTIEAPFFSDTFESFLHMSNPYFHFNFLALSKPIEEDQDPEQILCEVQL